MRSRALFTSGTGSGSWCRSSGASEKTETIAVYEKSIMSRAHRVGVGALTAGVLLYERKRKASNTVGRDPDGVTILTSLFGSRVVSGVRLSVLLVAELEHFLRLLS